VLQAQQTKPIKALIKVIGRAKPDAVLLRWSANQPQAWRYSTEYGYTIERITMQRNGENLAQTERIVINKQSLKPLAPNEWKALADTNKAAAIAWQAIYGQSFQPVMQGNNSNSTIKIAHQGRELQQRFTFALLACDQSFVVAQQAAMGFADTTVKAGEKYLYKIYTAVPPQKCVIDTGYIYIGLDNYFSLPKPLDVGAIFGDKSVMLSWNYTLFKNFYNSYNVERSDDGGKTFKRVNKQPAVNLNVKDSSRNARMVYIDSLPDNSKNYTYRVVGFTAFDETSPASEWVSGKGQPTLAFNPVIKEATLMGNNKVTITWEFPEQANDMIRGFSIQRCEKAGGYYDTLQNSIAPKNRKAVVAFDSNPNREQIDAPDIPKNKQLFSSNYFMITAIGKNGKTSASFPVLLDVVDTFPPAVPMGVTGVLDTVKGRVLLQWKVNKKMTCWDTEFIRQTG
jgi:uncharacterized protein